MKNEIQLSILGIEKLKNFSFGGSEYTIVNKNIKGLESCNKILHFELSRSDKNSIGPENSIYFYTEKERDEIYDKLNEVYGTDIHGNNIKGYFRCGIYIQDEVEIIQTFGDIFIFGISYIENSEEKMLQLSKEKHIFLKKQLKKTGQKIINK